MKSANASPVIVPLNVYIAVVLEIPSGVEMRMYPAAADRDLMPSTDKRQIIAHLEIIGHPWAGRAVRAIDSKARLPR